ncbi:MAG: 2-oxoacid:acceptor oxidoreductase subunit alpha [Anaerolineae bacterium]|jgi:2-oxoglutarate ferredoxin oxidoreductase subunit alpha|nr:MAG: 2-oxoacid:acceptor oxidoreductase subunit alpha [Anaerolineae bacterium]
MKTKILTDEQIETGTKIINDFSITVATVNGSGSQTSNAAILRAIFKMGIPVSGKNIFPSNIQGLPTWYTIRVNKHGFVARKREADLLISMNPATFTQDLASLKPGGAFFYADDIRLPITREDIVTYPMPVKQLIRQVDIPAYLKDYVANMVYVGILAQMIGIDLDKIRQALEFHFKGKAKPVEINFGVVSLAAQWAKENLEKKDPYFLEPMNATAGLILTDGNTAAALGAIYGGVQFVSWYPITPATSLAESLQTYLPKLRKDPETGKNTYVVVQAEDELAAIGMAIGAGWGGLRAMSSTSGPGLSLMTEYLGLGYFAEVPVVVWDIQRVGPSTGLPTRTSQGDLTFVAFMGHGDTQNIILMPGSVNECFEFAWKAFDLAEQYQTPVIVLSDLDFGMNQWMGKPFEYPDRPMQRGKVLWEEDLERLNGKWARYLDVDGDGVPYRTVIGNRHPKAAYFTRGTGHDEYANYSEAPEDWHALLNRLKKKFETLKPSLPQPIVEEMPNAQINLVSFGSTEPAIREARALLHDEGIASDFTRIRSYPFTDTVKEICSQYERNYIIEMNRDGQLHQLLRMHFPELAPKMISYAYTDGLPLTAKQIYDFILLKEKQDE